MFYSEKKKIIVRDKQKIVYTKFSIIVTSDNANRNEEVCEGYLLIANSVKKNFPSAIPYLY